MISPLHNFFLETNSSMTAPFASRAEGPSTWGSLFLLLDFRALGPPGQFSPTPGQQAFREDLVPSSLLTQFPGLDSGQDCDSNFHHSICGIGPRPPSQCTPALCVFHKLVHEPHQPLLRDGLTPRFLLQVFDGQVLKATKLTLLDTCTTSA